MTVIYWGNSSAKTCMYGTDLTYLADDYVVFKNEMLPSSTTIHEWTSKANYQVERLPLQLPILKEGCFYQLDWKMETVPENTAYFTIDCFDYSNRLIDTIICSGNHRTFLYPERAYYYKVKLVSAGCRELVFHQFSLSENGEMSSVTCSVSPLLYEEVGQKELNVLFRENIYDSPESLGEILKQVGNIRVITSVFKDARLYMDEDCRLTVESLLDKAFQEKRRVRLIGYGPISNIAALFYQKYYPEARAYITRDFLSPDFYREQYEAYCQKEWLFDSMTEDRRDNQVVYYGQEVQHPIFIRLLDKKRELVGLTTYLLGEEKKEC